MGFQRIRDRRLLRHQRALRWRDDGEISALAQAIKLALAEDVPAPKPKGQVHRRKREAPPPAPVAELVGEIVGTFWHVELPPDPAMIGEHEVQPVRCEHCGTPVPWAKIKGHSS